MTSTPGYSGKALWQKLGITDTTRLKTVNAPEDYLSLLNDPPFAIDLEQQRPDMVHFFVNDHHELLPVLTQLQDEMPPNGAIWVSWNKQLTKKGGVTENNVRNAALSLKLVDIKVCAVSDVWSGLKLVIRKELR